VDELILEEGGRHARVSCPLNLIPSPGQYLLASDAPDAPLPVPLFYTDSAPRGVAGAPSGDFIAAAPVPDSWTPGHELHLRGPLGRGFALPLSARRVALVAFDADPSRLRGLIRPALKQNAALVLLCDSAPGNVPDEVEVQPLSVLSEILEWADYLALDMARERLPELRERSVNGQPARAAREAQILVRTPVPCGGMAECGVCAVTLRSGWKLACKDGPVFDWSDIME